MPQPPPPGPDAALVAPLIRPRRASPAGARAELAEARLRAAGELAEALRTLRDDSRAYLESAHGPARAEFPAVFRTAVLELTDRFGARLNHRFGPGPPPSPPRSCPPGRAARFRLEARLTVAASVSGAIGLGRLAVEPALAAPRAVGLPAELGLVLVSVLVGVLVGLAGQVARSRRAGAERACLARWAAEGLADLRAALETALAQRVLHAERRLLSTTPRPSIPAARRPSDPPPCQSPPGQRDHRPTPHKKV
ncbi:hypothetical protein GCM10023321_40400 [Pseudonocardia eucalypti]|uniref:Uncharacterized protein n=1 Tax=Pseudonocardia eucalypti TaxID=648755 RepID=A0ABP9QBZ7_9PSEU|nr:hypothetical protein [Pseudonocardia eucalypti]